MAPSHGLAPSCGSLYDTASARDWKLSREETGKKLVADLSQRMTLLFSHLEPPLQWLGNQLKSTHDGSWRLHVTQSPQRLLINSAKHRTLGVETLKLYTQSTQEAVREDPRKAPVTKGGDSST